MDYQFPGNVRELKSVVELAAVLSRENEIKASSIQFRSHQRAFDLMEGEMSIREYTSRIVFHYLKKYKNVMTVARKLDMGKSTIYKMIKEDEKLNQLASSM